MISHLCIQNTFTPLQVVDKRNSIFCRYLTLSDGVVVQDEYLAHTEQG